jgi:hypothetical protein
MMKIVVACGFALALLGTLALEAAAQTSCRGWNAECRKRCGKANCPYCDEQKSSCGKTGCWTEGRLGDFPGKRHCNLKKS